VTWLDPVAILIVVLLAWLESIRGFGHAVFDLVGALISVKLAAFLAPTLAEMAPVSQSSAAGEGFWLSVTFVVLAGLTILASRLIYQSTLLSLDVLDPVVGAILGAASGMVAAHIFLKTILLAYTDTEFADVVTGSFVGQELLEFRTYHNVVQSLYNISNW
jgi:uncharacterized membrane protein required for colicin V production